MSSKPLPGMFVGDYITQKRIKQFYDGKRKKLTEGMPAGREETLAIWYSLAYVKELVAELEYLQADGVRIYFSVYEEEHPDYAGQLGLMLLPTRETDDMSHADIVLQEEPGFALRPGAQWFLDNPGKNPETEDPGMGFNYGRPCPHVCGGIKYPRLDGEEPESI